MDPGPGTSVWGNTPLLKYIGHRTVAWRLLGLSGPLWWMYQQQGFCWRPRHILQLSATVAILKTAALDMTGAASRFPVSGSRDLSVPPLPHHFKEALHPGTRSTRHTRRDEPSPKSLKLDVLMIEKTGLLEFDVLCSLSICLFLLEWPVQYCFSMEHDSMQETVDGKWAWSTLLNQLSSFITA